MRRTMATRFGFAMLALLLAVAARTAVAQEPVLVAPALVKVPTAEMLGQCYPALARAGLEGNVSLKVTISAEGELLGVEVPPEAAWWMKDGAECVAAQLEFKPGTRDGIPIAASATLPINFRLGGRYGSTATITRPKVITTSDEVLHIYRTCYPPGLDAETQLSYKITVTRSGKVRDPQLLDEGADARLAAAGLCIIRQLRFEPARRNGTAVTSTVGWPILVRPPH